MDNFDLVIMLVGGFLILAGLFLFIFGNKTGSKNYLEGFGVKVDVSNPSIILIVFGVFLMLVPRLLPANGPGVNTVGNTGNNPADTASNDTVTEQVQNAGIAIPVTQPAATSNDINPPGGQPGQIMPVQPVSNSSVYMPAGYWALSGYQEDGIDYEGIQGSINFNPGQGTTSWQASLGFLDFWGNQTVYQYSGTISTSGNNYYVSVLASNEPDFHAQQNIPLELFQENGGVLHMEYAYQGAQVVLHFVQ